jgi:hypothetical protein
MPHRGGRVVYVQGGEPASPFSDGGRGEVVIGLSVRGHSGSERRRLAWVCLGQPERLTCLVG